MRASTLFVLALAVLLGVGTVFAVQHFGLLSKKVVAEKKEEMPYVLVANSPLFTGHAAQPFNVKLRQITPEENSRWKLLQDKVLYPSVEAVQFRVLKKNVQVGTILLQEHFEDLKMPETLSLNLKNDHVSVYLSLPKEQVQGGMIRKDDIVDVYLTTSICYDRDCTNRDEKTAIIAQGLRVIAKRDSFWTQMGPLGDTMSFNLEANAFRAAVIEYAKRHGVVSLMPTRREMSMSGMSDSKMEMEKAIQFQNGTLSVDRQTLMDIFGVKLRPAPKPVPQPPAPQYARPKFKEVEIFGGVRKQTVLYYPNGFYPVNPNGGGFQGYPVNPNNGGNSGGGYPGNPGSYPGNPGETVPPPSLSPTSSAAPQNYDPTGPTIPVSGVLPMDDPMDAFISFRLPDSLNSNPISSKKSSCKNCGVNR